MISQAKQHKNLSCDLRRPGGHGGFRSGRPMALRLRLSPGLPLSDVTLCDHYYNTQEGFRTLQRTVSLLLIVARRLGNAGNTPM